MFGDRGEAIMTVFSSSIEIPASAEKVFAAMSDPERLARWWGPAGFSNTFSVFEFKAGGHWSFVMHGPDGANYPNESVFAEVDSPRRVVVDHASEPVFRLVISLTPSKLGTKVSWAQSFENDELASRMKAIVVPANDQNLQRLQTEVARIL